MGEHLFDLYFKFQNIYIYSFIVFKMCEVRHIRSEKPAIEIHTLIRVGGVIAILLFNAILTFQSPKQKISGDVFLKFPSTERECSGSVVECLTRDRRAAGSSLSGVTALWSLSKTHLS